MTTSYSPNFAYEPPPPLPTGGLVPFSADDFTTRIIQLLPPQWFNDAARAPVGNLWAIVSGFASSDTDLYGRIGSLRQSLRLMSATAIADLAIIARDFFGDALPPLVGESPDAYRNRISLRLFLSGGTREALRSTLNRLVGQDPVIVEPWNPGDCGAWDGPFGWDTAGRWGDLDRPWQGFLQTRRPVSTIAPVATVLAGWDGAVGWDQPLLTYADRLQAQVIPDSVVYEAINTVKPEGTVVWVQFE